MRFCEECSAETSEGKPFCIEHVEEMPYVFSLALLIEEDNRQRLACLDCDEPTGRLVGTNRCLPCEQVFEAAEDAKAKAEHEARKEAKRRRNLCIRCREAPRRTRKAVRCGPCAQAVKVERNRKRAERQDELELRRQRARRWRKEQKERRRAERNESMAPVRRIAYRRDPTVPHWDRLMAARARGCSVEEDRALQAEWVESVRSEARARLMSREGAA